MSKLRMWCSRRFTLPALLVLLMGTFVAAPSPADALALTFTDFESDCGGVSLISFWGGAPEGGQVMIALFHPAIGIDSSYEIAIDTTNGVGSQAVHLAYPEDLLDGWQIIMTIRDDQGMITFGYESAPFSRECFEGSVGPGGTGDGSVEAVDSRSGEVADPVAPAESAEDPDDDGRVQVP